MMEKKFKTNGPLFAKMEGKPLSLKQNLLNRAQLLNMSWSGTDLPGALSNTTEDLSGS